MRNFYHLMIFLCLLAIITSCQKEIESTLPGKTQSDSTDLARIIMLDTTEMPGQDTFYKVEYFYDAQKRRVIDVFTEYENSSMTPDIWIYRYHYLNNDTLPYKVTERYSGTTDSVSSYLRYTNGFITMDSTVDHAALYSTVYYFSALTGNRYLQKVINYDLATSTTIVQDSTIYTRSVVNGNWVAGLDSTWQVGGGGSMLMRANSRQYTFDNKPNPFSQFTLWYLGHYDNFESQTYIYGSYSMGMNNIVSLQSTEHFPPGSPEVQNYSYTNRDNGYPSVMRTNSIDGNKLVFEYTKL